MHTVTFEKGSAGFHSIRQNGTEIGYMSTSGGELWIYLRKPDAVPTGAYFSVGDFQAVSRIKRVGLGWKSKSAEAKAMMSAILRNVEAGEACRMMTERNAEPPMKIAERYGFDMFNGKRDEIMGRFAAARAS